MRKDTLTIALLLIIAVALVAIAIQPLPLLAFPRGRLTTAWAAANRAALRDQRTSLANAH
jgi:hypothetical protein